MRPREDPYHKLLYVLRGRVRYQESGRAAGVAAQGALLLVPAGMQHVIADDAPSTLLLLCVAKTFVETEPEVAELWRTLTDKGRRQLGVSGPGRAAFEQCWRRALLEQSHPRPGGAAAVRALALQVFVQLARLPREPAEETAASRVALVVREIDDTFFERWTLDAAAERAGMSRRHFSAHFRAATGRTFWEYLTDVRLRHAAQLIRRGEHSVTGVIFACGFGDVSQFYRLFRARYGQPPKTWAESRRQSS